MNVRQFSLTKSSPFDWKDDFLMVPQDNFLLLPPRGDGLVIVPYWQGKKIKEAFGFLGGLTKLKLDYLCLERIRKEFLKLRDQAFEKNEGCQDLKRKAARAFQCNKNIQCFNEKLVRFNKRFNDKSKELVLVPLLPVPELQSHKPLKTSPHVLLRMEEVLGIIMEDKALNVAALNKWVFSQHLSMQPKAYVAADAVIKNHISHSTFFNQLDSTLQNVMQKLQGRPSGLVSWICDSKSSGLWVNMLTKRLLKPTQELCVKKRLGQNFDLSYTSPQGPEDAKDWVIVDDALEDSDVINYDVVATVKEVLTNHIHLNDEIRIYIAIPYMTEKAYKELLSAFPDDPTSQVKVIIIEPQFMTPLNTITKDLSEEDSEAGNALIPTDESFPYIATTFTHRLPDESTLPYHLVQGTVLESNYKTMSREKTNDAQKADLVVLPKRLNTIRKLYRVEADRQTR